MLELLSPAKINLFLEVAGKRPDGFHELETVMLRTSLHDVMTFQPDESGKLSLNLADGTSDAMRSAFPLDESNLILQAAKALQWNSGHSSGSRITIEKNIPMQAGLAGGSSNAATTLAGLNQLWGLDLPRTQLHEIAATLGSDINFFVEDPAAAVCRGRGEQVSEIPVGSEFHFVVARPAKGNSTPEVFSRLQLPQEQRSPGDVVDALASGDSVALESSIFNRLIAAAKLVNTPMATLIQDMTSVAGRPTFMSGSGSTCFVVCRDKSDALDVVERCGPLETTFLSVLSSAA